MGGGRGRGGWGEGGGRQDAIDKMAPGTTVSLREEREGVMGRDLLLRVLGEEGDNGQC